MLFFLSYIEAAEIWGHFRSATRLEDEKNIYATSAACDTFLGYNKGKTVNVCVCLHTLLKTGLSTHIF